MSALWQANRVSLLCAIHDRKLVAACRTITAVAHYAPLHLLVEQDSHQA